MSCECTGCICERLRVDIRQLVDRVNYLEDRIDELEDPEPDHGEGCKCGDDAQVVMIMPRWRANMAPSGGRKPYCRQCECWR